MCVRQEAYQNNYLYDNRTNLFIIVRTNDGRIIIQRRNNNHPAKMSGILWDTTIKKSGCKDLYDKALLDKEVGSALLTLFDLYTKEYNIKIVDSVFDNDHKIGVTVCIVDMLKSLDMSTSKFLDVLAIDKFTLMKKIIGTKDVFSDTSIAVLKNKFIREVILY